MKINFEITIKDIGKTFNIAIDEKDLIIISKILYGAEYEVNANVGLFADISKAITYVKLIKEGYLPLTSHYWYKDGDIYYLAEGELKRYIVDVCRYYKIMKRKDKISKNLSWLIKKIVYVGGKCE